MRLSPLLMTCVTIAFGAAAADAPSLAGKWTMHMSIEGNEADMDCTFSQKGDQLTGSCTGAQASGPVKGTIAANQVKWTMQNEKGNNAIEYDGTLGSDGRITGKSNVPQYSVGGEFTATRAK